MKPLWILLVAAILILACNFGLVVTPPPALPSATPLRAVFDLSTPPPGGTPTAPLELASATASLAPTPLPTPVLVWRGPDAVQVPILLYHHIGYSPTNSRYYISEQLFEQQISRLHDWGYASLRTEQLVTAIQQGANLPPRPIILTFDDGDLDTFTTAFPILQKYGFTGVLYLVAKYVGADGYMDVSQIQAMYAAGWEVGSHSRTHRDLLTLTEAEQIEEIRNSRSILEDKLDLPVLTFSYPYGSMDTGLAGSVRTAGYIAAVGTIGSTSIQDQIHLFHLRRKEVEGSESLEAFSAFLPWQGIPQEVPVEAPAESSTPAL